MHENNSKRKSNFSLMANFRTDLSKDTIKLSEKDVVTFADIRKCSQMMS